MIKSDTRVSMLKLLFTFNFRSKIFFLNLIFAKYEGHMNALRAAKKIHYLKFLIEKIKKSFPLLQTVTLRNHQGQR